MMFNKILIANRGEIALRIIRACRELGIKTVVVHSTEERDSLPVLLADESVCIGKGPSKDSYLNIPSILSAVEITDAEAVHPGYGFLAENASFAEICENCGVVFIGPTSENMRLMGNKIKAREIVSKAGVPVLPGSEKPLKDEKEAFEIAKKIGFPVVIKAALGGGGRGMKVVHSPASFINAFLTSQSEAMAAFGDSEVYVEKYIEGSRHIEIQIMADKYGNIIHLGERDCTIQRRHQKLLEESPSPVVNEKLRARMGEAAVNAAKQVNYTNVGTVEFLLTPKGEFYFLEMNTRIQVEHPVTEMVTGIDIVKEQIRLAYGDRLRYRQKDIVLKGHAMECRINAEDPERFTPFPGVITKCYHPGGIGVRVDSHIMAGQRILLYYDSLISKVIVHAENRHNSIVRMKRALSEYIIEGVKTNIPFHLKLLSDPDFIKGNYDTKFVEKKYL